VALNELLDPQTFDVYHHQFPVWINPLSDGAISTATEKFPSKNPLASLPQLAPGSLFNLVIPICGWDICPYVEVL
jgi:hypothetical protein